MFQTVFCKMLKIHTEHQDIHKTCATQMHNSCKHTHTQREWVCTCLRTSLLCEILFLFNLSWSFNLLLFSPFFPSCFQRKLCMNAADHMKRIWTVGMCGKNSQAESWGPLIRYKNEWPSLAWGSPAAPCNAATHTMASATLPLAVLSTPSSEKSFC